MNCYLTLLKDVLEKGEYTKNRTGINTFSLFGYQIKMNLADGFPLLTTKKMYFKGILIEVLWFLMGSDNIKYLVDNDVFIWSHPCFENYLKQNNLLAQNPRYSKEWYESLNKFNQLIKENKDFALNYGKIKGVYGKQWVNWNCKDGKSINQIDQVIDLIKNDPTSRRMIVSAWNVEDVQESLRDPNAAPIGCHTIFQFSVRNNKLSCHMLMRSCDSFLGLPFNIASYALLTNMIAHVCNLELGDLIISFSDLHIYENHLDQAKLQLERTPKEKCNLILNKDIKSIYDFTYKDISLENYIYHPAIKADLAV